MSEIIKTKVTVESKIIASLIYDRSTNVLEVYYKHGKYKTKPLIISGIQQEQYDMILSSVSIGRAVEKLRRSKIANESWFGWITSKFKGYSF
jgi:hypothetical protein